MRRTIKINIYVHYCRKTDGRVGPCGTSPECPDQSVYDIPSTCELACTLHPNKCL